MSQQDNKILKRQELYDKVWSIPISKLCKEYNLLLEMASQLKAYNEVENLITQIRLKNDAELYNNTKLNQWLSWAESINEQRYPIKTTQFLDKFYIKDAIENDSDD
jgi:hypothetical protein